jgi:hypothetical protein
VYLTVKYNFIRSSPQLVTPPERSFLSNNHSRESRGNQHFQKRLDETYVPIAHGAQQRYDRFNAPINRHPDTSAQRIDAANSRNGLIVTSGGQYVINDQHSARGESLTSSNAGLRRMTSGHHVTPHSRQPPNYYDYREMSPSVTRHDHDAPTEIDYRSSHRIMATHSDYSSHSSHAPLDSNSAAGNYQQSRQHRLETRKSDSIINEQQTQQLHRSQQQYYLSSQNIEAAGTVDNSGKLQDPIAKEGIFKISYKSYPFSWVHKVRTHNGK